MGFRNEVEVNIWIKDVREFVCLCEEVQSFRIHDVQEAVVRRLAKRIDKLHS